LVNREETTLRNSVVFNLVAILGVAVFFVPLINLPADAQTKKITALEGVKFDTSVSMADNLKAYVGKDVIVHLRSGKTVEGYAKSVGNGLVHLEKIAGRDFYDALIRIDEVSAIEVKFRDMK
jgi:hypothetical protein